MSEYPPFDFRWVGVADGGFWTVGWPGLGEREYRFVGFPKRLNARKLFRKWVIEQTYGETIPCPQCGGQGYVRQAPKR